MSQIVALQDREEALRHIRKVQESFHIKAPDLPEEYPWLNVERPLSTHDLRGKVVLLDFWSYCCINCMHIQADLKYLEEKHAGRPFVVVGVHSAKFFNERDANNIRQAVLRHGIEHPVIVDQNFALWQAYSVHAWPTLILVDPDGNIEAVFTGEGNREVIDTYVDVLLEYYQEPGQGRTLNEEPIPRHLEKDKADNQRGNAPLNFPGEILADPDRQWLFISDSVNHRVLVTDLDGRILHTVGGPEPGFINGSFGTARFFRPQGLALYHDKLLVADTENHAIRQVDFKTGQVRTLAGTGWQGHYHQASGYGPEIPLSSPWGLHVVGDKCYIAMAGSHQIWVLDLELLTVEPYAGTGQEARIDGPRKKAAFAQPSGITADPDGRTLYIADSETSSVRAIDLVRGGQVSTVVGGDLFEFGDEDGRGDHVRLQHPLGIHYLDGKLYLADTYNHKIKIIEPKSHYARTYLGTGKPGHKDGLAPEFYEPAGLTSCGDRLFIADTNNHAVRVVDLHTHRVGTLEIHDHSASAQAPAAVPIDQTLSAAQTVAESPRAVSAGGFILRARIELPPEQEFTPGAPFVYLLLGSEDVFASPVLNKVQPSARPLKQVEIPVKLNTAYGRHSLRLQLQYIYCDKSPGGTCKIRTVEHQIPVDISAAGSGELVVHDVPANGQSAR